MVCGSLKSMNQNFPKLLEELINSIFVWKFRSPSMPSPRHIDTKITEKISLTLLYTSSIFDGFGFWMPKLYTLKAGPLRKVPFSSRIRENSNSGSCQGT